MKGFFYQSRYFLLPEDCGDVSELLERCNGKTITVTELFEKKCMAPYFVKEYTESAELTLDLESAVYPCEVEVLSMKEYNDRLREIVPKYCVGCPNFGDVDDTDESLDGHHEEVTLNKVCFMKNEAKADSQDYYYVNHWIASFVLEFSSLDLEEMLDAEEFDEARDAFCDALDDYVHCAIPPMWFSKNDDGKYEICCTTFTNDYDGLIMERIFASLEEEYGETWRFYNYIPKGNYVPEAKKPLGVSYLPVPDVETTLSLTVYAEEGFSSGAYLFLCGLFGERELQKVVGAIMIEEIAEGEDMPADMEDVSALDDVFAEILSQNEEELRSPAPHTIFFSSCKKEDASEEEIAADGGFYSYRSGYLCQNVVDAIQQKGRPEHIWENCGTLSLLSMPIARIVFHEMPIKIMGEMSENAVCAIKDISELSAKLPEKGILKIFAQVMKNGTFEIYGIVMNLTEFLYGIRYFAPLFEKYPAELYVYTESHKNGGHYKLGYEMKLLKKEAKLWK